MKNRLRKELIVLCLIIILLIVFRIFLVTLIEKNIISENSNLEKTSGKLLELIQFEVNEIEIDKKENINKLEYLISQEIITKISKDTSGLEELTKEDAQVLKIHTY